MAKKTSLKILYSLLKLLLRLTAILAIFLSFFIYDLAALYQNYTFEQVIFHLVTPQENISASTRSQITEVALPKALKISLIFALFTFFPKNHPIFIPVLKTGNYIQILPLPLFRTFYPLIAVVAFTVGLDETLTLLDYDSYKERRENDSTIYADYYVNPEKQTFVFPEQKQNLIFIYLESMESTFGDLSSGGRWHTNLIPNLTKLSQENLSFTDGLTSLGSGYMATNTSWTIASIVATSTGLPYKYPLFNATYQGDAKFLPGATAIGDILLEEGYNQQFLLGSEATYVAKDKFFTQHGNFHITDYDYAVENKRIPTTYYENWGYEDEKVFEYAKEALLDLSSQNAPFNLTMLTADTHFPNGYVCHLCESNHDLQIENVVACADTQIYSFIQWVQKQDFYENTTIILLGDHLFMEDSFFAQQKIATRDRRIYNCIINPVIQPERDNTLRKVTNLDFFPTTLAALGVTWDDDRLALGTNLFTSSKTLIEEMGIQEFNTALGQSSSFYDMNFFTS